MNDAMTIALIKSYIKKYSPGGTTPGVIVQPDWDQNDSTAKDFIKNRTHWTEVQEELVFERHGVVFRQDVSTWRLEFDDVDFTVPSAGTLCRVVMGDREYTGAIRDAGNYFIIGNEKYYNMATDNDTGEQYCVYLGDYGRIEMYSEESVNGDTAAVYMLTNEKVHKIDSKYLPDQSKDWNQNDPTAPDYIKNRPFYEEVVREPLTIPFGVLNYTQEIIDEFCKQATTAKFEVEGKEFVYTRSFNDFNIVPFYISDGENEYAVTVATKNVESAHKHGIVFQSQHDKNKKASVTIFTSAIHNHQLDKKYLPSINLYVCSEGEYITGDTPTISNLDKNTTYLVPQNDDGTLYTAWVYADGAWQFVDTLTVSVDEAEGGSGKDCFTEADKAEIVNAVIAALPKYTGEVIAV